MGVYDANFLNFQTHYSVFPWHHHQELRTCTRVKFYQAYLNYTQTRNGWKKCLVSTVLRTYCVRETENTDPTRTSLKVDNGAGVCPRGAQKDFTDWLEVDLSSTLRVSVWYAHYKTWWYPLLCTTKSELESAWKIQCGSMNKFQKRVRTLDCVHNCCISHCPLIDNCIDLHGSLYLNTSALPVSFKKKNARMIFEFAWENELCINHKLRFSILHLIWI